jgi:short-subunit dehydrogenase
VALGLGATVAALAAYRFLRSEKLEGQVVLITGGSRGLGLALAEEFAKQGCKLIICARDEHELELARQRLEAFGVEVLTLVCDVTEREQVQAMIANAKERMGKIDVLVNNAGIITVGPIEAQAVEDFERAMDTMFWGTLYPTLEVLPQMIERRGGKIVNITSIGGRISMPHLIPYNCAKFATVGLSEGLRAELRRHRIRVTTVVPGLMRTGSYIQAEMKGNMQAEYAWFGLSSALPLVTISAERAARRIVAAVRRGEADVVLTPQAKIAALAHGIAPGLTADVLGLINYSLPRPAGNLEERRKGQEIESRVIESPLTAMGKKAVRRYQHREPPDETRAAEA